MYTVNIPQVLQLLALVCVFLGAVGVNTGRVSMGWLGLGLWLLSRILV